MADATPAEAARADSKPPGKRLARHLLAQLKAANGRQLPFKALQKLGMQELLASSTLNKAARKAQASQAIDLLANAGKLRVSVGGSDPCLVDGGGDASDVTSAGRVVQYVSKRNRSEAGKRRETPTASKRLAKAKNCPPVACSPPLQDARAPDADRGRAKAGAARTKPTKCQVPPAAAPVGKPRAPRKDAWAAETTEHSFATVSSDHAETPRDAYVDIAPFLHACAEAISSSPAAIRLYDPYYCAGSVVGHLNSLGFARVANRNVDCYRTPPPPHDVLITNPPYSGDHLERIVGRCAARDAPFALLVPTYVLGKAPWRAAAASLRPPPFYVVPHKRYTYLPPGWAMDARRAGDAGLATSPFETVWCCWAPDATRALCRDEGEGEAKAGKMQFSRKRVAAFWTLAAVPSEHRDVTDPDKGRRPNPKARRRLAAIKRQRAARYTDS